MTESINCDQCGDEFAYPGDCDAPGEIFCSRECQQEWRRERYSEGDDR